jgi:hypothetical protein
VDNVGALSMPFIGQYDIGRRAVKGREAVMVEFQWRREIETGKGRRWGAIIFGGEEGEEVRWLHSAGDRRHSEERHVGRGGRMWQLVSEGQR